MAGILLAFFGLGFLFAALYAAGLTYHWLRFGYMYPWVFIAMPIYYAGTVFFLLIMIGAIAAV